ncbi:MAG: choice-of-anchor J domain-containing protein [bacterium]
MKSMLPVKKQNSMRVAFSFLVCLSVCFFTYVQAANIKVPAFADGVLAPSPHSIESIDDSTIYEEDFESGIGGWVTVDLTNPGSMWHKDNFNAYSGNSWWCGDSLLEGYNNNWLQYLVTPAINLSTSQTPILTFQQYWAIELPEVWGFYDGWDGCNVWVSITSGNTWEILMPSSPPYTNSSLYSFGWRWEMGAGVPGWSGYSAGWIEISFDLSAYRTQNVMFRFAFASDEATCTTDDPSLIGLFIDDIEVRDGGNVYLSNNANGTAFPQEFTTQAGSPSGNFWALTQDDYHSPTHSWNCDDQDFLSNALVSPVISIPDEMQTHLSYWVFCDMPDWDGDLDDYLDDYYYIEVKNVSDIIWTPIAYDWAHDGSGQQWVERISGFWDNLPTNELNLSAWAGEDVQMRFRTVTDNNDDGGTGEGVFIDDVKLTSFVIPDNDVGASNLIIPFPTYAGQGEIQCFIDVVNYGIQDQSQVPLFWEVNGVETALIPWLSVNAGATITRTFLWQPPAEGVYDFKGYTSLEGDTIRSNDSSYAGIVEVTPAGTFEFGYDHRQITYFPDFYTFNFQPGTGPMVYFTPADDGVPGILDGEYIKGMFYSEGTFNLHIYADGEENSPGEEVYTTSVTIGEDDMYPNWAEMDLTDVSYLSGGHPNFWVWFEIIQQDYAPHIIGHLKDNVQAGHFFTFNDHDANETIVNFNIRAVMTGTTPVAPFDFTNIPDYAQLLPNYPNPFNSSTRIDFVIPQRQTIRLTVYDLLGRSIEVLSQDDIYLPGRHSLVWNTGHFASGIYWIVLEVDGFSLVQKALLLK